MPDEAPSRPPAGPADDELEFDLDAWKAIVELDPDGEAGLVKELADTFIGDAEDKLAELRGCLSASDAAGVHRLTHQLKSSAATLGLLRMSRISRTIDEDARRGGLETATRLLGALEAAYASGRDWLRARVGER